MKLFPFILFLIVALHSASAADVRMGQVEEINRNRELQNKTQDANLNLREEEQVPEIIPGDREDMGPQYILKKKQIRKWFSVDLTSQGMYTSNMLLQSDRYAVDTTLLASTAQFSISPDAFDLENGDKISPGIGFRHQWFNYNLIDDASMSRYQDDTYQEDAGGYNEFDFDAQTISTGLYYLKGDHWIFGLNFEFTRLLGHEISHVFPQSSNYSEFYKEYVPIWSATRLIEMTPITSMAITYTGKLRYTDSQNVFEEDQTDGTNRRDINNRLDSILDISLKHEIFPTINVQPFFRFQYSNYNMNENRNDLSYKDREDFTYTYGSTFSWQPTDWLTLSTFGSWEKRKSSSNRVDEYSKYDLGGGLSASIRF